MCTGEGVICASCGTWIPAGTYHTCNDSYYDKRFDYKCPNCKGEFNHPGTFRSTTNIEAVYRCPFCGKAMSGIN